MRSHWRSASSTKEARIRCGPTSKSSSTSSLKGSTVNAVSTPHLPPEVSHGREEGDSIQQDPSEEARVDFMKLPLEAGDVN